MLNYTRGTPPPKGPGGCRDHKKIKIVPISSEARQAWHGRKGNMDLRVGLSRAIVAVDLVLLAARTRNAGQGDVTSDLAVVAASAGAF